MQSRAACSLCAAAPFGRIVRAKEWRVLPAAVRLARQRQNYPGQTSAPLLNTLGEKPAELLSTATAADWLPCSARHGAMDPTPRQRLVAISTLPVKDRHSRVASMLSLRRGLAKDFQQTPGRRRRAGCPKNSSLLIDSSSMFDPYSVHGCHSFRSSPSSAMILRAFPETNHAIPKADRAIASPQ